MTALTQALAELRALRDHVAELNAQYVAKGFSMARETQQRLTKANAHIQSSEKFIGSSEEFQIILSATYELCNLLRYEAGETIHGNNIS